MNASIRSATVADLPAIVRVHQNAFDGFFLTELGPRFLHNFYGAFVTDLRARLLVAADEESNVVGVLAGTSAPAAFFSSLRRRRGVSLGLAALPYLFRHPWKVAERLLAALHYRGDRPANVPAGYWLLSSLAVTRSSGGRGIGRDLVARFCGEASRAGAAGVYLLTDEDDNEAVQRFYKKQRFAVHEVYYRRDGRRMRVLTRQLLQ